MFEVGAIFQVVLHGTFGGVKAISMVFQFYLNSLVAPLTFAQVVDDMAELTETFATDVALLQTDNYNWIGYSVQTLNGTDVSGFNAFAAPIVGDDTTNDSWPSQTAAVLTFATGQSRRIMKKFVPGLPVTALAPGGNLDATWVVSLISLGTTLLGELEATNAGWRYCHSDVVYNPPGTVVFPQTIAVSVVPKVQRRRRG